MIQESLRSIRTLHSAEGGDVAATLMRPEVGLGVGNPAIALGV